MEKDITAELRRRGIAASTIRDALGQWIISETDRIIKALATVEPSHINLLSVQADAKALFKLTTQLELAMKRGDVSEFN
jgi:hypothetical protein